MHAMRVVCVSDGYYARNFLHEEGWVKGTRRNQNRNNSYKYNIKNTVLVEYKARSYDVDIATIDYLLYSDFEVAVIDYLLYSVRSTRGRANTYLWYYSWNQCLSSVRILHEI